MTIMTKIGIIGAMDLEVDALKAQLTLEKEITKAGMTFCEGTLNGAQVVIVKCGIGKVNAGMCVQILADLFNVTHVINTGVAGSLNADMPAGSLMLINDHINFSGKNPLLGANDEKYGPRFIDLSSAYDLDLRQKIKDIAKISNIQLFEGVYLMVLGPNFETAAEIRAFKVLGADAVGMSTVPEVLSAVYTGMKVLGVSVITNLGTGLKTSVQSHAETLHEAQKATQKLATLLKAYMEE